MKRTNKYLDNLVTKILNETLEEKAESLMAKFDPNPSFDYIQEGETCECGSKEFYEGMCVECGTMKGEVMEKECMEGDPGCMGEGTIYELELDETEEVDFDEMDFEMSKRKEERDEKRRGRGLYQNLDNPHTRKHMALHNPELASRYDDPFTELDEDEMEEGNAFTDALRKTPKGGKFKLGGKEYTDRSNLEERWKGEVDVEKTGEYSNKTIKQLDAEIERLKNKTEKVKESGKKVSKADREKMSELYFAKRAKQGWPGKGKSKVEETLYRLSDDKGFELFTEDEIIDLIEGIVVEEKKKRNIKKGLEPKGLTKYREAHKGSGKENVDYLKSVGKKMTDYIKDGSKGKYETNPKHFPKGNGQLAKMDKMAYEIPDEGKKFNLDIAGLNIPDYDEIMPDKKKIKGQIQGSNINANNPEWANAEDTGVNKMFADIFDEDPLGKLKDKSYNRYDQPVVLNKSKGKKSKNGLNLTEEFDRMKGLITYNRKTQ